jgi:hypothetical protein
VVAVWQSEQHQKCPDCGTFGWEWDEADEPWHPDHYTCRGCKGLTQHRKQVENAVQDGTKYALFRRERGD